MLGCKNFLRSGVIFVKYREVSTRTILLNFISNCRDSVVFAFWRPQQLRGRGGRVRPHWFSWPTKAILQGNQEGPCVQAHAFAAVTLYSDVHDQLLSDNAYRAIH